MLMSMWGNEHSHILLVEVKINAIPLVGHLDVFINILNAYAFDSAIPLPGISYIFIHTCVQRWMWENIHYSIACCDLRLQTM